MTSYCMPYFLEDKTGKITGSDYIDIHDRMRLSLRCTARDSMHTAYMIYNTTASYYNGGHMKPSVALDFGPGHSFGTISFGSGDHMPMQQYLVKTSPLGNSKDRCFVASDGQRYQWSWRVTSDQEWTCTNVDGYLVAFYSLKIRGEPEYSTSSGCMLTIDEAYPHLAADILASLMIMRHIAAFDL